MQSIEQLTSICDLGGHLEEEVVRHIARFRHRAEQ